MRRAARTFTAAACAAALGGGIMTFAAPPAAAHPLAPSLLELRELGGGRYAVRWKTSLYQPAGARPEPRLPETCRRLDDPVTTRDGTAVEERFHVDCGVRELAGQDIGVAGLDTSRTSALVRIVFADGRVVRSLVDSGSPSLTVPERESRIDVARRTFLLGVEHLLTGFDHLLFLLGLCLIVTGRKPLVLTITAFTLGHSVTLSLATLGFVRFPSSLAEAAIALSIVILAAEIVRQPARPDSWLRRRPWRIAFAFGLLHGLGFAGALAEIGLPANEIPLSLLSFNLGIEVGQLLFVGALLALARLAGPVLDALPAAIVRLPAYAIGSLAAFWVFERLFGTP
jgi:hydrogenase/urease accessory protein HupE